MSKIANQFQSYLAVIYCSFLANLAVLIQTNKIKGVNRENDLPSTIWNTTGNLTEHWRSAGQLFHRLR